MSYHVLYTCTCIVGPYTRDILTDGILLLKDDILCPSILATVLCTSSVLVLIKYNANLCENPYWKDYHPRC